MKTCLNTCLQRYFTNYAIAMHGTELSETEPQSESQIQGLFSPCEMRSRELKGSFWLQTRLNFGIALIFRMWWFRSNTESQLEFGRVVKTWKVVKRHYFKVQAWKTWEMNIDNDKSWSVISSLCERSKTMLLNYGASVFGIFRKFSRGLCKIRSWKAMEFRCKVWVWVSPRLGAVPGSIESKSVFQ